ncbi:hypothetical protein WISP_22959 [Willisornis vidua]|uniref:Proline-rich protein PRCC n=1 Tax=Willisornis vidua TaxID=1566151 RepID=A0ABQ9DND1_9PASS|nr:hypothetical protein WISP_22959 [Willisornis vidua]
MTNCFPFSCQDYYSSGYYPEVEPAQAPPPEPSTDSSSSFIDDEAVGTLSVLLCNVALSSPRPQTPPGSHGAAPQLGLCSHWVGWVAVPWGLSVVWTWESFPQSAELLLQPGLQGLMRTDQKGLLRLEKVSKVMESNCSPSTAKATSKPCPHVPHPTRDGDSTTAMSLPGMFKRLQGKRNRGREEINFVDIKGDDQLSGAQQWLTKSLTEEKTMKSFSKAKERELELKNTWSENKLSRRQTQAKYGF